MSMATCW